MLCVVIIKTKKMTKITTTQKANYITKLVKSIGEDINHALDIVCWYTMTEKEENEVKKIIKQKFNN